VRPAAHRRASRQRLAGARGLKHLLRLPQQAPMRRGSAHATICKGPVAASAVSAELVADDARRAAGRGRAPRHRAQVSKIDPGMPQEEAKAHLADKISGFIQARRARPSPPARAVPPRSEQPVQRRARRL